MIHSVYLIYKGMRLVSYHLDKMMTDDDDIFTGYLSAISNFAKDFVGDEIHEILMAQHMNSAISIIGILRPKIFFNFSIASFKLWVVIIVTLTEDI